MYIICRYRYVYIYIYDAHTHIHMYMHMQRQRKEQHKKERRTLCTDTWTPNAKPATWALPMACAPGSSVEHLRRPGGSDQRHQYQTQTANDPPALTLRVQAPKYEMYALKPDYGS